VGNQGIPSPGRGLTLHRENVASPSTASSRSVPEKPPSSVVAANPTSCLNEPALPPSGGPASDHSILLRSNFLPRLTLPRLPLHRAWPGPFPFHAHLFPPHHTQPSQDDSTRPPPNGPPHYSIHGITPICFAASRNLAL